MVWKCLIVDDEPPAQRIVERFLNDLPDMEVIGKCKNAFEAGSVLQKQEVNMMFLDINMPKLNGLNFLKTLKNPPAVILTTAYREYALEAFELDVVDYLKKPFSFERFYKAVNKAIDHLSSVEKISNVPAEIHKPEPLRNFIFIKEDKVTYKVDTESIQYIESVGDYNKIHTPHKIYLTYQTLKKLQELLPDDKFPRIHKSFIIALSKIESIIGNQVKIAGASLPIGQTYRKSFFDLIE